MPQVPGGDDPAVIKLRHGRRIDPRRQRQGWLDELVFEFGDQLGFPVEALDLPCTEGEGSDGDQRCTRSALKLHRQSVENE